MTPISTPTNGSSSTFEEHIASAFESVRQSLATALGEASCDPSQPQEVARRLGINRNLTWKVSKVICTPDLFQAMQHMPGHEGIEILSNAAEKSGASQPAIARIASTLHEFERVVELHAGDWATLELILDSMGGAGSEERMEQSRRLAFRGNSAIWGVQTRVRVNTMVIAPAKDKADWLDMAMLAGVVDFRCLRPNVRWRLFRPQVYREHDGNPMDADLGPLDVGLSDSSGPTLLSEFCSPRMPQIRKRREGTALVFELMESPVGNTGAFTCFMGTLIRGGAPRYASADDPTMGFSVQVGMPAEHALLDVLMHRSLGVTAMPELRTFGQVHTPDPNMPEHDLPMEERARELVGLPPAISTPLVPRYDDLVRHTLDRAGWNARDFRAIRLAVKYPPMHSTIMMKFPLPVR